MNHSKPQKLSYVATVLKGRSPKAKGVINADLDIPPKTANYRSFYSRVKKEGDINGVTEALV